MRNAHVVAIAAACLVGSVLMILARVSPLEVWRVVLIEPWTTAYGLGQIIAKATPLLCTGLAVWIARHAGLFNLGAESQLIVGCAAYAVIGAADVPAPLAAVVAIAGALAAGAAIGAIIGAFKAYRNANEVVVAIALNAVVVAGIMALGHNYVFVGSVLRTTTTASATWMPSLGLSHSQANASVWLALAFAVASGWIMKHTRLGFEIRLIGQRPTVAAFGGVAVGRVTCVAMAWAGAAAALASAHYVGGYKHAYEAQMGAGMGLLGIGVALLGGRSIPGLIAAAAGFGALLHGALLASRLVPKELIDAVLALLVVALAAATATDSKAVGAREASDG